jgi:hypothetical protein
MISEGEYDGKTGQYIAVTFGPLMPRARWVTHFYDQNTV